MTNSETEVLLLDKQIEAARREIASDGYDMSVGELLNLYKDDELKIHPAFQRLFRWTDTQETRFIESPRDEAGYRSRPA